MPLNELNLSPDEAAAFLLHYHNLVRPRTLQGKDAVTNYVRKVGCIQFDPLNVCGRNADLVLQSRIENYKTGWLDDALYEDRSLIEGWNKQMAISDIRDWPLLSRLRTAHSASYLKRYREIEDHLERYYEEVKTKGPLSSLHFSHEEKVDWAWGSTRLSKAALENLFHSGRLGIHHREHTRRVYDLIERLLPESVLNTADPYPDEKAYRKAHIIRRIEAAGLAGFSARDFWYGIARCDMKQIRQIMAELLEEKALYKVRIADSKRDWYAPARLIDSFPETVDPYGEKAALLAPLDNMTWNRELLEDAFAFYYRWEVYTPAAKREYGYYVLPVLYKGEIIGRCEPYLEKKNNRILLKGFWPEAGIEPDTELTESLREMFADFCRFLGAGRMATSPSISPAWRRALKGITSSEE
ncbi:MAG: crosslink repair DNA glycosylase YcaQ family protein [Spirochaetales bacterium]|nr:crosslink repair DNA glycosylase YcaQ family protein [Spirochaetales bacterium]